MRFLRHEELEERTLLSISGTEYALICGEFSDYELSADMSETHLIELTETTADSLRAAVAEAQNSAENDLIVVRLSDGETLDFSGETVDIDVSYENAGTISLVGLTLSGETAEISEFLSDSAYSVAAGTFFNGTIYCSVEESVKSGEFEASAAGQNQAVAVSDAVTGLDELLADERFSNIDGSGYSIVVIDTGINSEHDYFLDDDGNSRIVFQYDFANDDTTAEDTEGHGTNVASIAAGNGEYGGLASGANIIVLKVFNDDGTGNFDAIEEALQWVADNAEAYNIVSVNMSLGTSTTYSSAPSEKGLGIADEVTELADRGIIVVVAAGNEFYENGSLEGLSYPAILSGALAVGAVYSENVGRASYASGATDYTTGADRICSFSNRSSSLEMIMAAGGSITGAGIGSSASLVTYTGTSQASPILAGTAALAQQIANQYLGRSLTVEEFNALVTETADIIYDGDDENDNVQNTNASYYRVNVYALAEAIYGLSTGEYVIGENDGADEEPPADESETLAATTISVTATGTRTAKLTVEAVDGAASYTLEISASADFSKASTFTLSRAGTFTVSGLSEGTVYYFRAQAAADGAESSEWSETVTLAAGSSSRTTPLTAPTLLSVSVTETSATVLFETVENAGSYLLEYSTDADFQNAQSVALSAENAGIVTLTGLASGTTYYLRIKAVGTGTNTDSAWSASLTVDIPAAADPEEPATPPADDTASLDAPVLSDLTATGLSTARFTVSTVDGASGYLLQISTSPNFSTVQEIELSRAGTYTLSGLKSGTVYYLRIMALSANDGAVSSDWSETVSLSIPMPSFNDRWNASSRYGRFRW